MPRPLSEERLAIVLAHIDDVLAKCCFPNVRDALLSFGEEHPEELGRYLVRRLKRLGTEQVDKLLVQMLSGGRIGGYISNAMAHVGPVDGLLIVLLSQIVKHGRVNREKIGRVLPPPSAL